MRRTFLKTACLLVTASTLTAAESEWTSIFNGEDLTDWTPKIRGYEFGEDPKDTFRVEDGAITVSYENYDDWGDAFGHLFYKSEFSHYRIRLEYRFIGEQAPNGPGWATQNSGIMLHCQDPESMGIEQNFPASLEFQLLGEENPVETTGNLCTPGTYISIDGDVVKRHCINCDIATLPTDEWVTAEAEVHGSEVVRHLVNGQVAMEYTDTRLDPDDAFSAAIIEANGGEDELDSGWISLQSESSPVQFRNIEIMELEENSTEDSE